MTNRDRLFTNATLRCPEPAPPGHDSVAVADGTIVAVGTRAEAEAALRDDHEVLDLHGHTLAPGFIDAHLHPLPACYFEHHEDLSDCESLEAVFDRLTDRAAARPGDEWIVGFQIDDENLAEGRLPTRVELDRIADGRAVVLLRRDGHHAVGSTAALRAAGIDAHTPDPPGGTIHHDADGQLTGLCAERASSMVMAGVPLPDFADFRDAMDRLVARYARHGVTAWSAMCQTSAEGPAGEAGALEDAAWSLLIDRVPFDIQTILIAPTMEHFATLTGGPLDQPGADRRLDSVKLFLDGTLGGHTACMHAPFADTPSTGMLTQEPDAAYGQMVAAHLAGLQVCLHAIGDRANSVAAELFTRLYRDHPADPAVNRHRVEHASVVDPATIEAFAALGVSAVVQPVSLASEARWLAKRLGDDRLASTYPYRALRDAQVVVAGSSDAPIESIDVLAAMQCATERNGISPAQAITPAEALAMYTTDAAWVRHVEHRVGSIAVGCRGDLVELVGDPSRDVSSLEVVATICAGRELYRRDPRVR